MIPFTKIYFLRVEQIEIYLINKIVLTKISDNIDFSNTI